MTHDWERTPRGPRDTIDIDIRPERYVSLGCIQYCHSSKIYIQDMSCVQVSVNLISTYVGILSSLYCFHILP